MNRQWALVASAGDLGASDRDRVAREMQAWLDGGGSGVAVVTCHRAELYGLGAAPAIDAARELSDDESILHLLRVAAGLESVIVGEDEVLHQVREALRNARAAGHVDPRLQRLFEIAIAAGRRARSGRTESSGNLAQRAVAWLQSKANVHDQTVVVAGAGRMGAALAHSLTEAGAEVVVASRDPQRAARLAHVYSARGVGLRAGADIAGQAAAVAVALGGPWTELDSISAPIADISAPQAVPEPVRQRLNGSFLGIDDLYRQTRPLPGAYIKDAEQLVALKAAEYGVWLERVR